MTEPHTSPWRWGPIGAAVAVAAWARGVPAAVANGWTTWRDQGREAAVARLAQHMEPVFGLSSWLWLALCLVMAVALRLYFWTIKAGMHYPDEIFQYLEPAYWKMHGHGWLAWEFRRGARNWLLPWHYGALMEMGEALGLRGWALHRFLTLHTALFSVLAVPGAFRLGLAVGRGDGRVAVLSAAAVAAFPLLGYFAPHTLSEAHALVFTTWAYALWMEQVHAPERFGRYRRAFMVGLLLGLVIVARTSLLVLVPLPLLDYNFRARFREVFTCLAGLAVAMLALGLSDAIMWGTPFNSIIEYIKFNWIEGGAEKLETKPALFYWDTLFVHGLGFGRWLLLVPALAVFWRHWRMLVVGAVVFGVFSKIGIKQERFLLVLWPFLLVAAVSGWVHLADLARRFPNRHWARFRWREHVVVGVCLVCAAAVWARSYDGTMDMRMRWMSALFRAQDWIGAQPDVTGVLLDGRVHGNGGHILLGASVPQAAFQSSLLQSEVFNYVAAYSPAAVARMDRLVTFEHVGTFEDDELVEVYHRRKGLIDADAEVPAATPWHPQIGKQVGVAYIKSCLKEPPVSIGVARHARGWLSNAEVECARGRTLRWPGHSDDGGFEPLSCPAKTHAVGLWGRAGAVVDALGLVCEAADGKRTRGPALGGRGGVAFELVCETTWTGVGLAWNARQRAVDGIVLQCAP